jgi:glycerophosphoryl diester phosphodiesterase
LNRSRGTQTGLYVEPKAPAWHEAEGRDIIAATVEQLAESGYRRRGDRAFLQSFDLPCLQRARVEIGTDLKLVQLIGENSWGENDCDFDEMRTPRGLREIAGFADGIGPWLPHLIRFTREGFPDISELVHQAHEVGLFVHAYTLRADQLPPEAGDIRAAAQRLFAAVGLDGVFTDHPDQVLGSGLSSAAASAAARGR